MSSIESVLLTGGSSRRMGTDKASLKVDGVTIGERTAALLAAVGSLTICGLEPIPGYPFQQDLLEGAGPVAALARFEPVAKLVFVAACDIPRFDVSVIESLQAEIGEADAAIPLLDGRPQPLCALYRARAFAVARQLADDGEQRVMKWISELEVVPVSAINPAWITGVNTPEELARILSGS